MFSRLLAIQRAPKVKDREASPGIKPFNDPPEDKQKGEIQRVFEFSEFIQAVRNTPMDARAAFISRAATI